MERKYGKHEDKIQRNAEGRGKGVEKKRKCLNRNK